MPHPTINDPPVPDQRGYNLSGKPEGVRAYTLDVQADDVLGLAAALGRSTFALVGHDWGAVLGWHLAARHPDQIDRAVILNGPHLAAMRDYTHPVPSRSDAQKLVYRPLPGAVATGAPSERIRLRVVASSADPHQPARGVPGRRSGALSRGLGAARRAHGHP